jgi:peptide deformylase
MFRAGVTRHLRSAVVQKSLIPPPVMGPRLRPAASVLMDVDGPVRNIRVASQKGQSASLRQVADELAAVANATRTNAIGAPSLGYDARVLVVKSGIDTRVLVNPVITEVSQATSTAWDADGEMVYRVVRPRNVSVKYTTLDGDEEEWFNMAESESLGVQRVMDALDGVSTVEHVAPCVATEPSLYPSAVKQGLVGVMPKSLYESYKGHLSLLVDIKSISRQLAA